MPPDKELLAEADAILQGTRDLIHARYRFFQSMASEFGVTLPQFYVLAYVNNNPGVSVAQISKGVDLAKSTVSGIIDRLERDGLLTRETDPEDRRNVRVYRSEQAVKQLRAVPQHYRTVLAGLLGEYSREARQHLLEGLQTMVEIMRKLEDGGTHAR